MPTIQPDSMTPIRSDKQLRVAPMRPDDVDAILAIERHSFTSPWTREMFLTEISSRTGRAFVFRSESDIVGYLCFWAVLDEAHLLNVAVHPGWRGRGHGRWILDHLERLCLQEGLTRVILEVGRRNLVARNLYRKCGFNAIGFRKRYYVETNEDALVMEKWLSSNQVQSIPPADPNLP